MFFSSRTRSLKRCYTVQKKYLCRGIGYSPLTPLCLLPPISFLFPFISLPLLLRFLHSSLSSFLFTFFFSSLPPSPSLSLPSLFVFTLSLCPSPPSFPSSLSFLLLTTSLLHVAVLYRIEILSHRITCLHHCVHFTMLWDFVRSRAYTNSNEPIHTNEIQICPCQTPTGGSVIGLYQWSCKLMVLDHAMSEKSRVEKPYVIIFSPWKYECEWLLANRQKCSC